MSNEIKAEVGKGFFQEIFGGKSFIHCVVEAGIKNPRDWGATRIHLITDNPDEFGIVDDGNGLSSKNRDAFLSVNRSSTTQAFQSGRFGTGTKQFLFSHAVSVHVRTAPKEEPNLVYVFEFTTEEYEELALTKGKLKPQVLKKTTATWPHMHQTQDGTWHHEFGTHLTYRLARPKSSAIYRGERLAKKLSDRLSRKFGDIVSVDNLGTLPPKEMIGQPFNTARSIPMLGPVDVDIYRPKTRHGEDGLRLTGHEVGEATISSFLAAVSGMRGVKLDRFYAHPEVCGTISAQYLAEYATEARDSINPAVADDKKTVLLIRYLNMIAPAAATTLKIVRETQDDGGEKQFIRDIIAYVNRCYSVQEPPPGTSNDPSSSDEEDDDTNDEDDRPSQGQVLRVKVDPEYEIGQEFTVRVRIRKDVRSAYQPTAIQWHYHQSRSKNARLNSDGSLTLTAETEGVGCISAEIPGTPYHDLKRFMIVHKRNFGIYPPELNARVGSRHTIQVLHGDKITPGKLQWKHEGVGQFTPGAKAGKFEATRPGMARITAFDSEHPEICARCEINVTAQENVNQMHIRGVWYNVDVGAYATDEFNRPAVIVDYQPNRMLCINSNAPGYAEERKRGRLHDFVIQAIAMEHARFTLLTKLKSETDATRLDPAQLGTITEEMFTEGFEIYRELLPQE